MKKLIIGIIASPEMDQDGYEFNKVGKPYIDVILNLNCIPLVIPPLANVDYNKEEIPPLSINDVNMYQEMVDMCDGLIIPGGNKIYNYFEYVAKYSLKKDIPILGICMGMQLLALIDNNEYCLKKNDTNINHHQMHIDYAHKINVLKDTKLYNIISSEIIDVNSCHNYYVDKLNEFIASAYSQDGIIEAIEHPDKKFVLGVQWHPEKMYSYDINAKKIFASFLLACEKEKISI